MGKNLIIKGADFSENGLKYSYLIGITDAEFNLCENATSPGTAAQRYMFADKLSVFSSLVSGGNAILGLRMKISAAGIIPIYLADFSSDTGAMSNYQFKENLNVPQNMVGNIVNINFTTPIYLQANQKIVFGNKNELTMTAKWYYGYQNGQFENLCLCQNGSTWTVSTAPLSIDYLIFD